MITTISQRDELPETSSFFDYMISNSQIVAIFIMDESGRIICTSKGVHNTYGYTVEDLKGKYFSLLFTNEDQLAKKPETELATVLEKGSAADYNYVVSKQGIKIWTQGESVLVKDRSGRRFIVKNVQNVNQEIILKELLSEAEKKQNFLYEIINSEEHGMILFKAISNADKKIIDFEYVLLNKSAEKLLDRSMEDLVGKKWLKEYPYMKEVGIFDVQVKTVETGQTQKKEFYYGHQGFNKWYKNVFIRVDGDAVLVTFDDITDQKLANIKLEEKVKDRTQEVLKANQDLRNINEYLDESAYLISHDLKAPLAAIEGLIPIIREDYTNKPLDQNGEEILDMIEVKSKDMRSIIDEILKNSKNKKKSKEYVNVYDTVQEVVETLTPPAHFHILIQHSLPVVLYNRISLMRIMQNLLENAIKYMDKAQPLIKVTFAEKPKQYVICISDNGPGIPDTQLENIFNVFESYNTKDEIESHGIGLSIVKQLVTENGGKIWVESQLGKETKFHFTILKE